jgi:hypothetical protein
MSAACVVLSGLRVPKHGCSVILIDVQTQYAPHVHPLYPSRSANYFTAQFVQGLESQLRLWRAEH